MVNSKVLAAAERNIRKISSEVKIVRKYGEVYPQCFFLEMIINYGRLLRKAQYRAILK